MALFSMQGLDIGWVTLAKKSKFALSTYSREFFGLDSLCPSGDGTMGGMKMKYEIRN
jgi:hypothetical protein